MSTFHLFTFKKNPTTTGGQWHLKKIPLPLKGQKKTQLHKDWWSVILKNPHKKKDNH